MSKLTPLSEEELKGLAEYAMNRPRLLTRDRILRLIAEVREARTPATEYEQRITTLQDQLEEETEHLRRMTNIALEREQRISDAELEVSKWALEMSHAVFGSHTRDRGRIVDAIEEMKTHITQLLDDRAGLERQIEADAEAVRVAVEAERERNAKLILAGAQFATGDAYNVLISVVSRLRTRGEQETAKA